MTQRVEVDAVFRLSMLHAQAAKTGGVGATIDGVFGDCYNYDVDGVMYFVTTAARSFNSCFRAASFFAMVSASSFAMM